MAFLAVKRSFCAILVSRIVRKPHFQEGAETMANTRQEAWDLNKLFEESILAMRSCEAAVAEAMKKAEA